MVEKHSAHTQGIYVMNIKPTVIPGLAALAFAAAAAPPLTEVPAYGSGIQFSGSNWNDIGLQSISLQRMSANGASLNGLSVNGMGVNAMSWNALTINGIDPVRAREVGADLRLMAVTLADDRTFILR
jgi:hypothetical protein